MKAEVTEGTLHFWKKAGACNEGFKANTNAGSSGLAGLGTGPRSVAVSAGGAYFVIQSDHHSTPACEHVQTLKVHW